MELLKVDNVGFEYFSEEKSIFKLSSINFSIIRGEFVSLLGPNGSGKSTLIKILSNLIRPNSGNVYYNNKSINSYPAKELAKLVAVVPQSFSSIFPYSVYDTVMMGRTPYLNLFGYESQKDRDIVNNALELVEISHLRDKGLNEVSGGEAQRAFIARALVQEPEILLLDEPSSHLDIKHQIATFNILKELNKKNSITIFTISHDLNLSGNYSDRIILMESGKIKADGKTVEILNKENIENTFKVKSEVESDIKRNKVNIRIIPEEKLTL